MTTSGSSTGGVLIYTASIGSGHDVAAGRVAADLRARGVQTTIADGLAAMGPLITSVIESGSRYESAGGDRLYDLAYLAGVRSRGGRALSGRLLRAAGASHLLEDVARRDPALVISTYPATTRVLGALRAAGRLNAPLAATVTDLAGLDLWVHPAADLHLVARAEALPEVQRLGADGALAARGLNGVGFDVPVCGARARRALALPADGRVVVVSGGGWGVGDLTGAADAALGAGADAVVVVCGHNRALLGELSRRAEGDERLHVLGYTDRMPEILAAADVVVHSSGGLTSLEAAVSGCRVISYGWRRGHLRLNDRAFERTGLAAVARSRRELRGALRDAFAAPALPDGRWRTLPLASEVLLDRYPQLLVPSAPTGRSLPVALAA